MSEEIISEIEPREWVKMIFDSCDYEWVEKEVEKVWANFRDRSSPADAFCAISCLMSTFILVVGKESKLDKRKILCFFSCAVDGLLDEMGEGDCNE